MFSSLSFNQPARRFWKNRAEPDFGPGNASSLIKCGGKPAVVPEVSTPSRRTNATGRSVGTLFYLVSFGLTAAATIGIFFGIGFLLLASPASETITDSGRGPLRSNGNALQASEAVLKFAGETETPHSAAVNLIPGSLLGQGPAAAELAPSQQNKSAQELSPAPPSSEPPVETTSVPQPVSGAAVSPAYPIPLASPTAAAPADGALSAGNRGPTARDGRSAHARTVSRHSPPRSAHGAPTLTPP
jgi:hypothetical protein